MKKTAFCGLMLALALIAGYVESLVPVVFPIPGLKLGVANSIILLLLYRTEEKTVGAVSLCRVILSGFLFGNLASILYSASGAVVSFCVMVIAKKRQCFSKTGVSVLGGISHNIGQLSMAFLVLKSSAVWWYLPVLLAAGCISGYLIGSLASEVDQRIFPAKGQSTAGYKDKKECE